MKITKVDVLHLKTNLKNGHWRPIVCRIYTDEGIYGDGEAALAYGESQIAAFGIVQNFAKLIIGMDPLQHEVIWDKLYRTTFWGQNGGPVIFAGISAIDIALWDIKGKKLGVIGLGAIGCEVANAAAALGMEVYGYDPFISIDAAWNLSRTIKHSKSLDEIYSQCDYITIHVPLTDNTRKMIDKEAFTKMKEGVVLLNFARDLLVDEEALIEALDSGKVKKYVTDFANPLVAGRPGILVTPHLGASTAESEENCAVMAVKEVRDFLENGNIKNSVNFPNCDMGTCIAVGRITICHKNIPNMISQFTKILGSEGLNIADMTNKSRGSYAYTIIDLESAASKEALDELKAIEGVSKVRVIK